MDGLGGQAGEQPVEEVAGDVVAGRFDTAHDHRFAPGAIGVNPTRRTLRLRHRGGRADAQ
ncbi:hypothetical protein GCM10010335_53100 [Streptomyces galbus]|nr:hypothetical protein GCM10010335_53100 [Streptomyces galbus]